MFCANKNSYLQLACAVNPKVVNKAVRCAMRKTQFDPHDELPPAQRMESMQPSLYAPWIDITRIRLGFGRVGLRIINRDIKSDDSLIQLQAVHTLLDQVSVSENAMFLIQLNVAYNLIDLLTSPDPIVREKVALILTHLATYYQGRKRIMARPVVIDRLMFIFMRDRKEIRYAAALCFNTLTREKCSCGVIMQNEKIVENLLKAVKNDHVGIMLYHLNSLKNLSEWDPVKPLKENAFQVMQQLMQEQDPRIARAAIDCLTQLCKHSVGKKLADIHDMTKVLLKYLQSEDMGTVITALGLMNYTTLTTKSKWRAKEFLWNLTKYLVSLAVRNKLPVVQLRAMQVMINLCDCPDIRAHLKGHWMKTIVKNVNIRTPEQWDGTSEDGNYGVVIGHNYRTMYIKGLETIKNDSGNYDDNTYIINVRNYLKRVGEVKDHLIKAINKIPD